MAHGHMRANAKKAFSAFHVCVWVMRTECSSNKSHTYRITSNLIR